MNEAAVDGTEIIVHCAGSSTGDEDKTRHLAPDRAVGRRTWGAFLGARVSPRGHGQSGPR